MSKLSLNIGLSRNPETPIRPLARRMLAWVLLISAVNAVLATSVQLYLDYRRDLADLEEHLSFVRDSHLQGLAAAAWNFDRPLVEAQLSGLVGSPWVAAAELRYGRTDEQRLAIGEPRRQDGVKAFPWNTTSARAPWWSVTCACCRTWRWSISAPWIAA